MSVGELTVPLGIISYVFLFLAVASGLLKFKFKVRWIKADWHMWLGSAALGLATAHALIVLMYY